jgi:hypothetical protein
MPYHLATAPRLKKALHKPWSGTGLDETPATPLHATATLALALWTPAQPGEGLLQVNDECMHQTWFNFSLHLYDLRNPGPKSKKPIYQGILAMGSKLAAAKLAARSSASPHQKTPVRNTCNSNKREWRCVGSSTYEENTIGGETGANAKYSWNVLMGMGSCTVAQVAALL